jgi:hypothetical protein
VRLARQRGALTVADRNGEDGKASLRRTGLPRRQTSSYTWPLRKEGWPVRLEKETGVVQWVSR